jgi:4-alpha-glucanotransferase
VEIMGDLPFMVGRDSADVWANQREFRDDATVGAPPDQFNEDGQDWGLPPYKWDAMRANDFAWLRKRARYAGLLYDRFRIDHLVGFYRTYVRPHRKPGDPPGKLPAGAFDPAEERAQLVHGERVIHAMKDAARERNAALIAEDLGMVPTWVRASLAKLGVPGYKVLIWEQRDGVFLDPKSYPTVSVACFGTHDTDPVAVWWESRGSAEREAVKKLDGLRECSDQLGSEFTPTVHRALLDLIHATPSELVLLLMQDVLGTRERVNTPATMGAHNWSYRLPAPIEQLHESDGVREIMARVRESIVGSGR